MKILQSCGLGGASIKSSLHEYLVKIQNRVSRRRKSRINEAENHDNHFWHHIFPKQAFFIIKWPLDKLKLQGKAKWINNTGRAYHMKIATVNSKRINIVLTPEMKPNEERKHRPYCLFYPYSLYLLI